MTDQAVLHDTFVIQREYPKPAQTVFAAFADPAKKCRWYATARSHDTEHFEMDFRVGGVDRGSYRFREGTPFPGVLFSNINTYLDIVPDRRIVSAYTMAFGDKPFSASMATVELVPTESGTRLVFTHQGAYFENADGPAMRKGGWEKLLESLARELEQEPIAAAHEFHAGGGIASS